LQCPLQIQRCKGKVNTMDNKTKILLFFPIALAVILAVAANYVEIPFSKGIPETANSIAAFTPAGLKIKEKRRVDSSPDLKSLLDFDHSGAAETSLQVNNTVHREDNNDKGVSLIIISGAEKSAVINGVPVKEGDRIADMKIVRIEADRVLLKNKTLKWMYIE
jgi:hypothetical protein